MAGHSQFKNIMHRKGAQDAKRAKIFTKLIREITVSARSGGIDPEANPRLRTALACARQANMPKDNIERALRKSTESHEAYESIRYGGYGPGNIAILVEALTDNRNRTSPEIRSIFNKLGGSVAETSSVSFLFTQQGLIVYPLHENLLEEAIELGATDLKEWQEEGQDFVSLFCAHDAFFAFRESLEARFGPSIEAALAWIPSVPIALQDKDQRTVLENLFNALEDHDDVQAVWSNLEETTKPLE
jgi:YebC/PmpR family DNA-binding regulatory protein